MTTEGHYPIDPPRRSALKGSAGHLMHETQSELAGTPEKSGGQRASDAHEPRAANGAGHFTGEAHYVAARPNPSSNGQMICEIHRNDAVESDDHLQADIQLDRVIAGDAGGQNATELQTRVAPIIAEIREQWRERQDHHNAEKRLTLQIKARCRRFCGGDKTEGGKLYTAMSGKKEHPLASDARAANIWLLESRSIVEKHRKTLEKRLCELARQLPVSEWWCAIKGCNALGLAALVGEAGDLNAYANPGKLWKRFGLQVYRGSAPSTWRRNGLPAKEWEEVGYAPRRRAVLFTIGTSLFMHSGMDGHYRLVYDAYKARKATELPDHTKKYIHNMAGRYMEKRLLKHLWQAWRAANPEAAPSEALPPAKSNGKGAPK